MLRSLLYSHSYCLTPSLSLAKTTHRGGVARAGTGVLEWVKATLASRSAAVGASDAADAPTVQHDVTVFDPIEVFGPGGALESSGAHLSSPHFFFAKGSAPPAMEAMAAAIKAADAYIIVTAEYNHAPPPALLAMLDHFGGSNFNAKPSGIITYSPSPWGGARGAITLQPILHELGALPVSAMVHLPGCGDLFAEDGTPSDPAHRMLNQLPKMLTQLEWMALAMKTQRDAIGTW